MLNGRASADPTTSVGYTNILFLEDVKLHKTKVKLYVPSHVEHKNKKSLRIRELNKTIQPTV